ncbi:MAG TPA: hypothetical protein VF664_13925, partial [Cystobacter sp.]
PAVLEASVAARGRWVRAVVFLLLLIAPWLAYWALRHLLVRPPRSTSRGVARKSDHPGPLPK